MCSCLNVQAGRPSWLVAFVVASLIGGCYAVAKLFVA
jgi:hypothetical protein